MKIATPLAGAALIAGWLGCDPTTQPTTFHPPTDRQLGYIRLQSGERAVIWKHCKLAIDGVTAIEGELGRAPVPRATVVVHDPAARGAPPAAVATSTAKRFRVPLGQPARGTRVLTVLEGPVAPESLARLLPALRDPPDCRPGSTQGGVLDLLPDPCLPCIPQAECTPCPPACPDPPCPGLTPAR